MSAATMRTCLPPAGRWRLLRRSCLPRPSGSLSQKHSTVSIPFMRQRLPPAHRRYCVRSESDCRLCRLPRGSRGFARIMRRDSRPHLHGADLCSYASLYGLVSRSWLAAWRRLSRYGRSINMTTRIPLQVRRRRKRRHSPNTFTVLALPPCSRLAMRRALPGCPTRVQCTAFITRYVNGRSCCTATRSCRFCTRTHPSIAARPRPAVSTGSWRWPGARREKPGSGGGRNQPGVWGWRNRDRQR